MINFNLIIEFFEILLLHTEIQKKEKHNNSKALFVFLMHFENNSSYKPNLCLQTSILQIWFSIYFC